MSDEKVDDDRLSELQRLAALLCDQVLDARIMKRAIPEEQARALAEAAAVLRDREVALPPLMTQALHEIGQSAPDRTAREGPAGTVGRLSRLLGPFRRG